jgi:ribulose-phosphate 3-epimerase
MTLTPERQFDAFISAGCSRVIFHAEATVHAHRLIQQIKEAGAEAGVAINPATPVAVLEPILADIDLALVMTVNPGWGGQKLIASTLDKVRQIRALRPELSIEVDGGIDAFTVAAAKEAGANVFVVGSHLAKADDLGWAVRNIKDLLA